MDKLLDPNEEFWNTMHNVSRAEYSKLLTEAVLCGAGSFGTVYRVRWHDRMVALKKFNTDKTERDFRRELSLLKNCDHPNIVKIFAAGPNFPERISFMIMEFADCFSLDDVLHKLPQVRYDLYHCLFWIAQVAQGADYLHRQCQPPIIHGDLKPANMILFNSGLIVKLTDFGAAGLLADCNRRRPITLIYTAPEISCVQSGMSLDYTDKCDVYALAVSFWEILARQRPYANSTKDCKHTIFWNIYRRRPDPLRACPPLLSRLMERGWAENPKERPSMQLFVTLLNQLLDLLFGPSHAPQSLQVPSELPVTEPTDTDHRRDADSDNELEGGPSFVLEPLSLDSIGKVPEANTSVRHLISQPLNISCSPQPD